MKTIYKTALSLIAGSVAITSANAQTAGSILAVPVVAAGNILTGVASVNQQIAPVIHRVSPTFIPATEGVTTGVGAIASGVKSSGQRIGKYGLFVGSTDISGPPLVSVGSTGPASQGSVLPLLSAPKK